MSKRTLGILATVVGSAFGAWWLTTQRRSRGCQDAAAGARTRHGHFRQHASRVRRRGDSVTPVDVLATVKLICADLEGPLPPCPGVPYGAQWVLVRLHGHPARVRLSAGGRLRARRAARAGARELAGPIATAPRRQISIGAAPRMPDACSASRRTCPRTPAAGTARSRSPSARATAQRSSASASTPLAALDYPATPPRHPDCRQRANRFGDARRRGALSADALRVRAAARPRLGAQPRHP